MTTKVAPANRPKKTKVRSASAKTSSSASSNGKVKGNPFNDGSYLPAKVKGLRSRVCKFDAKRASAWLEFNKPRDRNDNLHNRPVYKATVSLYAGMMYDGEFALTAQGITTGWNQRLLNGQHQLEAVRQYYQMCEEEGTKAKPVELYVHEGDDPENFVFYDQGKNRTVADVLATEGEDHSKELGVAIRLLWIRVHGGKVRGTGKLLPHKLAEFLNEFKGLRNSVAWILKLGKGEDEIPVKSLLSPGYAAALHYLMCNAEGGSKEIADKFWNNAIQREGDKDSAPCRLHVKLLKQKDAEAKWNRDTLVNYCVSAFNRFVDKEKGNWTVGRDEYPHLGGYDGCMVEDAEEIQE
jgi:hypothetical protein